MIILISQFFLIKKIGRVGKNGTGKTTLFNIIQGNLTPDKGDIEIAKNTRIVTVKQEVDDFSQSN